MLKLSTFLEALLITSFDGVLNLSLLQHETWTQLLPRTPHNLKEQVEMGLQISNPQTVQSDVQKSASLRGAWADSE